MQITLNQKEIETAIINFVGSQGISITGKHVDVTLVAGRGPSGMSASIDISNDDPTPVNNPESVKRKKKEPKEVQEEVPFDDDDTENVEDTKDEEYSEPTEEEEDKPLFGV